MYLQLTTRCNMRCGHCCMSATSKGVDMPIEIAQEAIHKVCGDSWITLGGGEPTLYKHFDSLINILESVIYNNPNIYDEYAIMMITNGTRYRNTMKAIKLMENLEEMGYSDDFIIVLSYNDGYHDDAKIHPKLLSYFLQRSKQSKEAIRTVNRIINTGRAYNKDKEYECPCETIFVKPNGVVKVCGCPESPIIGTVHDDFLDIYNENWGSYLCYKDPDNELNRLSWRNKTA